MKLQLNDYVNYETLVCPSCGGDNLHHGVIETFYTNDHNAKTGDHLTIDVNGWVSKDKNIKQNPSPGRDGILIHFTCETCPAESVLSIAQHKGNTHMVMGLINKVISYDAKS
jgi:hypothetical protein